MKVFTNIVTTMVLMLSSISTFAGTEYYTYPATVYNMSDQCAMDLNHNPIEVIEDNQKSVFMKIYDSQADGNSQWVTDDTAINPGDDRYGDNYMAVRISNPTYCIVDYDVEDGIVGDTHVGCLSGDDVKYALVQLRNKDSSVNKIQVIPYDQLTKYTGCSTND